MLPWTSLLWLKMRGQRASRNFWLWCFAAQISGFMFAQRSHKRSTQHGSDVRIVIKPSLRPFEKNAIVGVSESVTIESSLKSRVERESRWLILTFITSPGLFVRETFPSSSYPTLTMACRRFSGYLHKKPFLICTRMSRVSLSLRNQTESFPEDLWNKSKLNRVRRKDEKKSFPRSFVEAFSLLEHSLLRHSTSQIFYFQLACSPRNEKLPPCLPSEAFLFVFWSGKKLI